MDIDVFMGVEVDKEVKSDRYLRSAMQVYCH